MIKLKDLKEPEIKQNALEGLTTIVHSSYNSVSQILRDIQNFAYQETEVRKDLIVEVDLGPFKHKVDHGLPTRKAAFQLLETLNLKGSFSSEEITRLLDTIIPNDSNKLEGLQDP